MSNDIFLPDENEVRQIDAAELKPDQQESRNHNPENVQKLILKAFKVSSGTACLKKKVNNNAQANVSSGKKMVGQGAARDVNLNPGESCGIGPANPRQRRKDAFEVRLDAAVLEKNLPLTGQTCNGDELRYANKIGNYSKALPHNQLGEVNLNAYQAFIEALITGNPADFETIPLGGVVKLANPQAAYAYELVGADSHHLRIDPPPAFSSAQEAAEMAELYWQALVRDVPFADYGTNLLTLAAAADLSSFSDFRGPKDGGNVTPATLFRIDVPGGLVGPYISQFLLMDIPFGATRITQRYQTPVAGLDFMTTYDEWLNIQNGHLPSGTIQYDATPRYIRNGRDLGEYVYRDFSFQATLSACLILLGLGANALAPTNPYLCSDTQAGFATFGAPHILDFVARASRAALEAAWYQKFLVHRRLRPEEFGGVVQNQMTGVACYPINKELLNSQVLAEVFNKYSSYLLPQAYPEGSPTHPAYPSGHAAFIGAGVTMLKAFFRESFVLSNPVVASSDGLALHPYEGPPLTVGGELNKLAVNIAMGRNFAGIHWRTDGSEGFRLGEEVAIRILQDYRNTYNEDFVGFSFTRFDGTKIIV